MCKRCDTVSGVECEDAEDESSTLTFRILLAFAAAWAAGGMLLVWRM